MSLSSFLLIHYHIRVSLLISNIISLYLQGLYLRILLQKGGFQLILMLDGPGRNGKYSEASDGEDLRLVPSAYFDRIQGLFLADPLIVQLKTDGLFVESRKTGQSSKSNQI